LASSPEAIRHRPRNEVGDGLRDAEGEEESQDCGGAGDPEDIGCKEREDGSLLADHPTDERIDRNQESGSPSSWRAGSSACPSR